jgi:hypothetical protein
MDSEDRINIFLRIDRAIGAAPLFLVWIRYRLLNLSVEDEEAFEREG